MGGIKKRREDNGLFYIAIECRIGYRKTYGIAAIDREDGEKIILGAIVDVSEDQDRVHRLADRFNREKVDFNNFRDVVEINIERDE